MTINAAMGPIPDPSAIDRGNLRYCTADQVLIVVKNNLMGVFERAWSASSSDPLYDTFT